MVILRETYLPVAASWLLYHPTVQWKPVHVASDVKCLVAGRPRVRMSATGVTGLCTAVQYGLIMP